MLLTREADQHPINNYSNNNNNNNNNNDNNTRLMQEYDAEETKYSVKNQVNLIMQKYMTQKTATKNIKNKLKPRI